MCYIDANEKENPSEYDDGSSGGGFILPLNSTTEAIVSLSAKIYFIGCWLQGLEHTFLEICNMYYETMTKLFQKIPVELTKPPSHKEKLQLLLHAIGGDCFMEKRMRIFQP